MMKQVTGNSSAAGNKSISERRSMEDVTRGMHRDAKAILKDRPKKFGAEALRRNPRKARQMNPIIEKVARASFHEECEPHKAETGYGDIFGWDDVVPVVRERHHSAARAAIRATLEHLRDNVSEGMAYAGVDECPLNYFQQKISRAEGSSFVRSSVSSDDAALVFRAMVSKALAELDA